jgi:two-component system sensor histidine kinase/response regulator
MRDYGPQSDLEESGLPAPRVLVVDDTPANLLALAGVLAPLGHEIVKAKSGADALALVAQGEFAVVLLDVRMPGMDGFETLSQLHAMPMAHHPPVILVTGYDMDLGLMERAYALGALDHVTKPLTAEIVRGKVTAFVSLYRRGQQLRNRDAALATKDRQIAMLAHDLRNPLSAVTTGAHLLIRLGADQRTGRIATRIARAAERMNSMVRDLLDYARIGAGAIPVMVSPMNMGDLCRELIEEFEIADPMRKIEITVDGEVTGEWDRARLYQALSNLVGNATRYGRGRATIGLRGDGQFMEVRVHNPGPPIPAKLLPNLFEPFQRAEQDGTGLGLGLYIVREVARAHRGDVSVEASDERGTAFVLRLPVRAAR